MPQSSHSNHDESSTIEDIDDAISGVFDTLKQSLCHSRRALLLRYLGSLFCARHDEIHQLADLDVAIEHHRASISLEQCDHKYRPSLLSHYGFVLHQRFHCTYDLADINAAVSQHLEALSLLPDQHNDRRDVLDNVSDTLRCRFDVTKERADIDMAIEMKRGAVSLSPTDPDTLSDLGQLLGERSQFLGDKKDCEEAVEVHRRAISYIPAHDATGKRCALSNALASTLFHAFNKMHDLALLDGGITLLRDTLSLSSSQAVTLANLSSCLLKRYDRTHDRRDLDEAEAFCRQALSYSETSESPESPESIRDFAIGIFADVLILQFEESNHLPKLNEAISCLYDHLANRADNIESVVRLAQALQHRFEVSALTDYRDLDEAIPHLRKARDTLSLHHPDRHKILVELTAVLSQRFHHSRDPSFLKEALEVQEEILLASPISKRSPSLSAIARTLLEKYHYYRDPADLDKCIGLQEERISLLAPQDQERGPALSHLVFSLQIRYKRHRSINDLCRAIELCRDGMNNPHIPPRSTSVFANFLGESLGFHINHTGQIDELDEATNMFRVASSHESMIFSQRLFGALIWAELADKHDHQSAMEAYTTAMVLLPRLLVQRFDVTSRWRVLTIGVDGLSRNAALYATRSGQHLKAVEFLEEGRAVFWSQALHLRTPLDALRSVNPNLADEFEELSRILEAESQEDHLRVGIWHDPKAALALETKENAVIQLNQKWHACINSIREVEGFGNFLKTKTFAELRPTAMNGPVVILLANELRNDVLILQPATTTNVLHIPLVSFTEEHKRKFQAMHAQVDAARGESVRKAFRISDTSKDPEDIMREGLAILWTVVAEPITRALNLKKSALPPRLWWCPTGIFALLPIHAAGVYSQNGEHCVSDYASYIPNLSTLLRDQRKEGGKPKVLAVIQPATKGQHPLPGTEEELRVIANIVPKDCLAVLGVSNAPATTSNVLSEVSDATILHLACHGIQDTHNPLESSLILDNGPLKVMKLAKNNDSLVFLSACQTAAADESLPDEAIHLAATAFCWIQRSCWNYVVD